MFYVKRTAMKNLIKSKLKQYEIPKTFEQTYFEIANKLKAKQVTHENK